jgi:hypothetical protein
VAGLPDPTPTSGSTSTPGLVRGGLAGLAAVSVLVLLIASFSDVVVVTGSGGRQVAADSGLDRHGPALLVLAIAIGVLTFLALRGARVAALGIGIVGLVVVLISLLGDVPDLQVTGGYQAFGSTATTEAGVGFYLETLGGALAILAGGGLWLTDPPEPAPTPPPARRRPDRPRSGPARKRP